MEQRYFEDLTEGETMRFGGRTVTRSSILDFAHKYDPLPFHVDAEAAEESMFDGLIASGLQTLVLCNRMVAEHFYLDTAIMGGPGMEEISIPRPVRPGDTISVEVEIGEKIPSKSKPDRGLVKVHQTCFNQSDEVVLRTTSLAFFERRNGSGEVCSSK